MTAAAQNFDTTLNRETFYIYDTWRPFRSLSITGGVAYDHLQYPTDYRNPPILNSESNRDHISPKVGLIWNPSGNLFLRAAYTRSSGGVSFDESVGSGTEPGRRIQSGVSKYYFRVHRRFRCCSHL